MKKDEYLKVVERIFRLHSPPEAAADLNRIFQKLRTESVENVGYVMVKLLTEEFFPLYQTPLLGDRFREAVMTGVLLGYSLTFHEGQEETAFMKALRTQQDTYFNAETDKIMDFREVQARGRAKENHNG